MTTTETASSNGHGKRPANNKAYDAPRGSTFKFAPEDVVIFGYDTKDDPTDELHDPRISLPVLDEDVENAVMFGILTPIITTKRDGKPYVVDGRQRVKLARAANKIIAKSGSTEAFAAKYGGPREPIEVHAVNFVGTAQALAERAAAANIHFTESLLSKAERAERVMARMPAKMTDAEKLERAARVFGVSPTAVRQWAAILKAAPAVRRAVDSGKISATAAYELSKAGTHGEQTTALEAMLASGEKPTAAAAARAAGKGDDKKPTKKRKKSGGDGDGDSDVALPSGPGRGKRSVKKALKRIEENKLRMPTEHKQIAEMVMLWCMGDDLDGELWVDVQNDKLLRSLTGRDPAEAEE